MEMECTRGKHTNDGALVAYDTALVHSHSIITVIQASMQNQRAGTRVP